MGLEAQTGGGSQQTPHSAHALFPFRFRECCLHPLLHVPADVVQLARAAASASERPVDTAVS